jgi:small-conductance mechanosensitive channel
VNILKHTQYCEGKGYVNSRSLNEAMSKERGQERVKTDFKQMASRINQQQQNTQQLNQGLLQQSNQQLAAQQANRPILTQVARFIARPLATLAKFAQRATQQLAQVPKQLAQLAGKAMQQAGNFISQLAGQLGSFFLNSKEARNEKNDEAKDKRDASDVGNADMFEVNTIKEPSKSSTS